MESAEDKLSPLRGRGRGSGRSRALRARGIGMRGVRGRGGVPRGAVQRGRVATRGTIPSSFPTSQPTAQSPKIPARNINKNINTFKIPPQRPLVARKESTEPRKNTPRIPPGRTTTYTPNTKHTRRGSGDNVSLGLSSVPPSKSLPAIPAPRQRSASTSSAQPIFATQLNGLSHQLNKSPKFRSTTGLFPLKREPTPGTAIWLATYAGEEKSMKGILQKQPNLLTSKDAEGETLLSFCTVTENISTVRMLLDLGADPTIPSTKGALPLHTACEKGNIEIAKLLLEYNASIHTPNSHTDKPPIHYAAGSPSVHMVDWLLCHGADVNYSNHFQISPIYIAVSKGNEAITNTLIQHNADPCYNGAQNCSLLHLAVMHLHFRVAKILVSHNADIDAVNNEGKPPFSLLNENYVNRKVGEAHSEKEGIDTVKEFVKWLFLYACTNDDPKIIKSILRDVPQHLPLEKPADLCGESSLSLALRFEGNKVCIALIEGGAYPKIPSENLPSRLFESKDENLIFATCSAFLKKKRLDFSSSGLQRIPEQVIEVLLAREEFMQVKRIDVSNNTLRNLSPSFLKFLHLEKVIMEGNPLDMIPETFRKNFSWPKIREYLKTVKHRALKWQACKLLVVGQEGVGKTTLIRSLQAKNGKTQVKTNISTDGVEIKSVNFSTSTDVPMDKDDQNLSLMIWDLGGQEVFYPTHQFYLTKNSIYIIGFDMSKIALKGDLTGSSFEEMESRISYWAQQIRDLSPKWSPSPFVLVGTHSDQIVGKEGVGKEEIISEQISMLRRKFPRHRFSGLVDIVAVSCKTGEGIEDLRSKIFQSVKRKGFLPRVSESWVKLHDHIQSFAQNGGLETTSRHVIMEWAHSCGVRDEEMDTALEFLCDMGSLLLFRGEQLNNLVVLDPRWLSSVMTSLITFHHSWVKEGTLPAQDIPQVFATFPPAIHETLLSLLEQFSIILRLQSGNILVPSALPEECRSSVRAQYWPNRQKDLVDEYGRIYRFPFLPLGFFGRIMARILHIPHILGKVYWRTGMIIQYNPTEEGIGDTMALLEYNPVQFCFSVRVRSPKSELGHTMFLQRIVDCVDTTLEEYYMRETAEKLVPCTHCIDSDSSLRASFGLATEASGPFLFSFAECVLAVTEGDGYLFCNHIKSPSRAVAVHKVAPDIALSGIPLIDESQLILGKELGRGGFGIVYAAEFQPITQGGKYPPSRRSTTHDFGEIPLHSKQVAVKELHCERHDLAMMYGDFQQEVFVMNVMSRHPNLVRLHGVCLFPKPRMILELLSEGDLFGFLHPSTGHASQQSYRPPSQYSWSLRLLMALDIAKGMFILHSNTPPIIHRDLRTPNIFLASTHIKAPVRAKVADFGLARIVPKDITGALNTWQWLAPEVLGVYESSDQKKKSYGISSDVYSFAICCWELATGGYPFDEFMEDKRFTSPGNQNEINVALVKQAIAFEHLRPTLLPAADCLDHAVEGQSIPAPFRLLIEECWQTDPSLRPSFTDIVDRLSRCANLEPKAQREVSQLLQRASTPDDRSSKESEYRVSVNFVPLQLPEVIQNRAASIRYHSEYKTGRTFQSPSTSSPSCALLVDGPNPSIWVGYPNGDLIVWDTARCEISWKWLSSFQHPVIALLADDANRIWICSSKGKVMIWDIPTCTVRRETSIRKQAICMASMRDKGGHQQIWIASSNSISIYKDGNLLHLLPFPKKKRISHLVQGGALAWVLSDEDIYLYDITSLSCVGMWPAHSSSVTAITSVGENFVWTASQREIAVWKIDGIDITCVQKFEAERECEYIYFSSIGNRVWLGVKPNMMLYDPITIKPLQEIVADGDPPADRILVLMPSYENNTLFCLTRHGNLKEMIHKNK